MTTIKDVAKKAGVSIATVSRVINGNTNVRTQTRENVTRAIEELNYTPSAIAQGLQKKETKTIGVIFPDASSYYFAEIIRGINRFLRQHSYQVVVSSSHDAEDEAKTFFTLVNGRQVDGVILMMPSIHNAEVINSQIQDLPAVLLNTEINTLDSVTLVIDNYQGAFEATIHLIEHGHTDIGFIHGSKHNYDSEERYRGYLDALEEAGITPNEEFESRGQFVENSGFEAALAMMEQPERPTAIFAANDAMAIGAIEAAKRLSLHIPDDVAIIGFDDISTARFVSPSLTTVNVPVLKIGQLAGEYLLKQIRDEAEEERKQVAVVPVSFMRRESCGCPASRHTDGQSN